MKDGKEKNILIWLLIIIIIVLIILIGLMFSGKIEFQHNDCPNKVTDKDTNQNNEKENNNDQVNQDDTNKDNSNNTDTFQNEMLDKSKIDGKTYDGSFGTIKDFRDEYYENSGNYKGEYQISLSLDGNVIVDKYEIEKTNSENNQQLENITNVVDLVNFVVPGVASEQLYYMLLSNGDVYYYKIGEFDNDNFKASKIENVKNVKQLFNYEWCPKKNAGCMWSIIAVTDNNQYIELNRESV